MKRDILIGDIHGCFDELTSLLDALDVTANDRLISVGDLVDRGPDSVRLWEFFRDRPHAHVIMGNHERKHVRGVLSYSQEIVRLQFGDQYDAFREWAATLPYYRETRDYIAVHGGYEAGLPLADQREDVLAGTTSGTRYLERRFDGADWTDQVRGPRPVVFGHRVVGDAPVWFGEHAVGLDTGACHGGFLSALVVPGFTLHRVPAQRDHWSQQRARWQVPVWQSRDWAGMKWAKLEREVASVQRARGPEATAYARSLKAWVDGLDAALPALVDAAATRVAALEHHHEPGKPLKRAIAEHAASAVLFASHAGTLDHAAARAHLPTPRALTRAAAALGLPLQGDPSE